jgi:hypothetical protein
MTDIDLRVLPGTPEILDPPVTKKIGSWVELDFDRRLMYAGLAWYRVKDGFGGRGDREDWVADVPSVGLSVTNRGSRGFSSGRRGWGWEGDRTFREEADYQIALGLQSAAQRRDKAARELVDAIDAFRLLEQAGSGDGMTDLTIVNCRARLEDDCLHGKPYTAQQPVEEAGETPTLHGDDTFDGESIVCDACYVRLMPFTRSGRALHDELPEAISVYVTNRDHVRGHDCPAELVEKARIRRDRARKGSPSPLWASANAAMNMALAEIERRGATS